MRHRSSNRKLNRTSSHRLAMFRNMANSLLLEETILTTLPKAKELRRVAEPLITLGKKASLSNRRLAFNRTRNREVVVKLFADLGPRFAKRKGGYISILKFGFREGDSAPLALVRLVDLAIPGSVVQEEQIPVVNVGGKSAEQEQISSSVADVIEATSPEVGVKAETTELMTEDDK